jgi:hypothetical protein
MQSPTAKPDGEESPQLREILPKSGIVMAEKSALNEVLCKPKILPLKSAVLEQLIKIEAMNANNDNDETADKDER